MESNMPKCPRLFSGRGRVEDANQIRHSFYHGAMASENTPLLSSSSIQAIEVERPEPTRGKTSFGLSVFNLMNAILGSGILGLPYAMAKSGIILFSLMLLFVAAVANYSIHLLLKMCDITGFKSYEDVGQSALGVPGKLMAACSILLQNIGAMSSYLFIVKNEFPAIISTFLRYEDVSGAWFVDGDYLVLLVVVCIILPLACLPKIGFLGYTSAFSILCMIFFTIVIVVKKFTFPCPIPVSPWNNHTHFTPIHVEPPEDNYNNQSTNQCKAKMFTVSLETAYTIPTMAFSFVCHTAVLPIYAELSRPTKRRMQHVATTSIGICYTLYMIASLFGYLTFYDATDSEVLHGYSLYNPYDLPLLIVRIAVVIAIILTIPLIHYPARLALLMIIGIIFHSSSRFSWWLYCLATIVLLCTVTTFAICVPNIMQIFGIIGATASTSLVFFLPSLFYLRLGHENLASRQKILALVLLLTSVLVLTLSLSTIIYGMVSKGATT